MKKSAPKPPVTTSPNVLDAHLISRSRTPARYRGHPKKANQANPKKMRISGACIEVRNWGDKGKAVTAGAGLQNQGQESDRAGLTIVDFVKRLPAALDQPSDSGLRAVDGGGA